MTSAVRGQPMIVPANTEVVTPVPVRGLHAKLAEVMAEVDRIPKNGKAPSSMGGFAFVQVGDAADAIRKALGSRKVSMLPTQVDIVSENEHATKSGGTMTTQSIRTTWTLTDGETGEQAVIQSLGTGADTGDKFSPKAQTNSMKYALLMGFLLSTGEDPELSDSSDRRSRTDRIAADAVERQGIQTRAPDPFDAGLIGIAEKSKTDMRVDFELRQVTTEERPEPHPQVAFRLTEGRKGWKVYARGVLAELVTEYRAGIEDQRVICWGEFSDESFRPKGATKDVVYQVLNLSRLKVGALDLTAPDPDEEPPMTPDEIEQLGALAFPDPVPA